MRSWPLWRLRRAIAAVRDRRELGGEMHVILWRFHARAGREAEFEAAYAQDGAWARLFRTDATYLGSELMRGSDDTYLALDRWTSAEAFRAFQDRHAAEYAALDARCEELTEDETPLGAVEV